MSQTRVYLINWVQGQYSSETLGAQILRLENYLGIAPVHPTGGQDGGKDIICHHKDGRKVIGGCYFPGQSEDKTFAAVTKKFTDDLEGAITNGAQIFAFLTNTAVTDGEEKTLRDLGIPKSCAVEVFDLDRIKLILDSPKGFGLRYQILGIKMSDEEQVSFFNNWENLLLEEVKRVGAQVNTMDGKVDDIQRMLSEIHQAQTGKGVAQTGNTGPFQ